IRAPRTSFVGREDELERLTALLGRARLVTLVGPGGAGKTRVAIEAALRLTPAARDRGRRPGRGVDGVWMVEPASLSDPGDVEGAVLDALGLRDERPRFGDGAPAAGTPIAQLWHGPVRACQRPGGLRQTAGTRLDPDPEGDPDA
ncbi:AAA family ATPase, partial [Nonomuraea terrae]|uniref:AAA family ATPase n=1 Tax=Nonomuraea terrae TaxID=2530383 RepID=UPI0014045A21